MGDLGTIFDIVNFWKIIYLNLIKYLFSLGVFYCLAILQPDQDGYPLQNFSSSPGTRTHSKKNPVFRAVLQQKIAGISKLKDEKFVLSFIPWKIISTGLKYNLNQVFYIVQPLVANLCTTVNLFIFLL